MKQHEDLSQTLSENISRLTALQNDLSVLDQVREIAEDVYILILYTLTAWVLGLIFSWINPGIDLLLSFIATVIALYITDRRKLPKAGKDTQVNPKRSSILEEYRSIIESMHSSQSLQSLIELLDEAYSDSPSEITSILESRIADILSSISDRPQELERKYWRILSKMLPQSDIKSVILDTIPADGDVEIVRIVAFYVAGDTIELYGDRQQARLCLARLLENMDFQVGRSPFNAVRDWMHSLESYAPSDILLAILALSELLPLLSPSDIKRLQPASRKLLWKSLLWRRLEGNLIPGFPLRLERMGPAYRLSVLEAAEKCSDPEAIPQIEELLSYNHLTDQEKLFQAAQQTLTSLRREEGRQTRMRELLRPQAAPAADNQLLRLVINTENRQEQQLLRAPEQHEAACGE